MAKIIWTRTDEAPLLASLSLRPIVSAFAATAGVENYQDRKSVV